MKGRAPPPQYDQAESRRLSTARFSSNIPGWILEVSGWILEVSGCATAVFCRCLHCVSGERRQILQQFIGDLKPFKTLLLVKILNKNILGYN
jgi:hypothetical protein